MKHFLFAVLGVAVTIAFVSCGTELDKAACARNGAELKAEARIINNRCVIKGWGEVR